MEFTVERGRLWFLQTRTAKRTPRAALKIAVDLVEEGVIGRKEALARLADVDLDATRAPASPSRRSLWRKPSSPHPASPADMRALPANGRRM